MLYTFNTKFCHCRVQEKNEKIFETRKTPFKFEVPTKVKTQMAISRFDNSLLLDFNPSLLGSKCVDIVLR
jgi:hypothetical protein